MALSPVIGVCGDAAVAARVSARDTPDLVPFAKVLSQTSDEAEQKHHSLLPMQPRRRTALRAFEVRALESATALCEWRA